MCWSRQITVFCDKCGNWDQQSTTLVRLRKYLKTHKGWIYRVDPETGQGQDYCDNCAKEFRREEGKE